MSEPTYGKRCACCRTRTIPSGEPGPVRCYTCRLGGCETCTATIEQDGDYWRVSRRGDVLMTALDSPGLAIAWAAERGLTGVIASEAQA